MNTHKQRLQLARQLPELKSMPLDEFIGWLADNEDMYKAFARYALDAVRNGRNRFSVYMIRERVRWYTNIEHKGHFKISNNLTPYIGRLLCLEFPILDKIFSKKEVTRNDFLKHQRSLWS